MTQGVSGEIVRLGCRDFTPPFTFFVFGYLSPSKISITKSGSTETLHEKLWDQLISKDLLQISECSGCRYLPDLGQFNLTLLGQECGVALSERRVFVLNENGHEIRASFLEELCILAYLLNSSKRPLSGKLVAAEKLEAGQFFFRGPHVLPTEKLESAFGNDPSRLLDAGVRCGAKKVSFGDAGIELLALPRIPIVFVVWGRDDEFAARASVLFDETVSQQIPLDALGALVNLAVKRLTSEA